MPPEVQKMRRWLHSQLEVAPGARVLDVGCGAGDDLRMLAASAPQAAWFVGVDQSEEWVRTALTETTDSRLEFRQANVDDGLPFDDASFDILYSVNLLECVSDKAALLTECARALKVKGQVLIAHFDWDTQTFDGEDRDLVRRVVYAYNEWKQAWMKEIDPWAGRRLWRTIVESGAFTGEIRTYTLTSNCFDEGSYARRQAESFAGLVRRGMISEKDYQNFMRFQLDAVDRGVFFYSVTLYAFVGVKR